MLYYQEFGPSPSLQPYVSKYYHFCTMSDVAEENRASFQVHPSGYIYINFNFAAIWHAIGDNRFLQGSPITINGQIWEQTIYYQAEGPADSIGIELIPSACARLFQIPMSNITNKMIPLEVILGYSLKSFYKTLWRQNHTENRIQLIEDWLNKLKKNALSVPLYILACQEMIDDYHGIIPVKFIAEELGYSVRTLEKQFLYFIGLPLKYFSQVKRINYIINCCNTLPEFDWQDALFEGGFFDQSHFIKTFKHVIRQTPSQYFKEKLPIQDHFIGR